MSVITRPHANIMELTKMEMRSMTVMLVVIGGYLLHREGLKIFKAMLLGISAAEYVLKAQSQRGLLHEC
jgi:hypothetical protein